MLQRCCCLLLILGVATSLFVAAEDSGAQAKTSQSTTTASAAAPTPDWADGLFVLVHPTVGLKAASREPAVTADGSLRADVDVELTAVKHIPHKSTVLVRVPQTALIIANGTVALTLRVARLIGMQRRCEANATALPGDEACDSPLLGYISDVMRRPGLDTAPAMALTEAQAKACLAAHHMKLYAAARAQWASIETAAKKSDQKLGATKADLKLAWSIVRTRAITAPTNGSAVEESMMTMLVPFIDMANHDGANPSAQLEYQRHSTGASIAEDGSVIARTRSDALDVLLVSTRSLKKGSPITLSYGNIRHPVDAVDTYGFLVEGFGSPALSDRLDEMLRARFPLIPIQMGFPDDKDFFGPRGCNDASIMVFNATTGRPANAVLPCASLAQLKGLGEAQGLIAMQTYVHGKMGKKERRQLAKAAWGLLAQQAGKLRDDEYALTQEQRSQCAAVVGRSSPKVVHAVSMATAATMHMRDAVARLQTYCNDRVKAMLAQGLADAEEQRKQDAAEQQKKSDEASTAPRTFAEL